MTFSHAITHSAISLAVYGNSCVAAFATPLGLNPGTYDITAETLLPHLEENLRYATTRQRHCLGTQDATTLFPILRHEALAGCALTNGQTTEEHHEYAILCSNPATATGTARLTVYAAAIRGVVENKMGGKNMTLSQRINGTRLGVCGEAK